MILVYHRIGGDAFPPCHIVPTLPAHVFRHQLEKLKEIGRIVPLCDLLESPDQTEFVRFVITLDDDYMSHATDALPILLDLDVPATFFLSGRSLHGLGHYWWEILEVSIANLGMQRTQEILGLRARTPQELAHRLEESPKNERLSSLVAKSLAPRHLQDKDIAMLAQSGMQIGFHTLHHPRLDTLAKKEITNALSEGRVELARAAGYPIEYLAYPHGRATPEIMHSAQAAGYKAAFTGDGKPVHPKTNRFGVGRWEPGHLLGAEFLASVILRLNR